MNILSLYILKKFIKPFLASFAALCCLIFVSQIFDRLDRFMADGVSIGHVLGFLLTSLPFQALQILPVACLLGTLFVVGNLARSREYIAGLAGGLPPETFLKGLFVAGFAISCTALFLNETFVPPATHYARTVFREKIRRLGDWNQMVFNKLIVAGSDGRMWTVRSLNQSAGTLDRVVVDTFLGGQISMQVDASSATIRPDGWQFTNGVVREFDTTTNGIKIITPFTERMFNFREKITDLVIQEPQPEEMTYKTLKKHIRQLEMLGVPVRSLEVELMIKLAFPFACFVVVVLGVPLALHGKGSPALGIAAGGILTLIYLGFMQFGKALAQRLVAPWLGAWLGNIVFLALGLFLWWRMRRAA